MFKIGVRDKALELIVSYLRNRTQRVRVNGTLSNEQPVLSGIPEGSLLGPILFLAYLNDIFNLELSGRIQLYADDMAIIYSEDSFEDLKLAMESDLRILTSFLTERNLSINFDKTQFIIFLTKNTPLENVFSSISVEDK